MCLTLLCSCANRDDAGDDSEPASFTERLNQRNGYMVDKQGNWVPRNNKRSSYENIGDSPYFSGAVEKKAYNTNDLSKKAWWGNKEVPRPAFATSADASGYHKDSNFNGEQAHLNHSLQTPNRIQGNTYSTNTAREASSGHLDKPSDAETDVRRRVFVQPSIIDYKEQRKLSIEESKKMLGH